MTRVSKQEERRNRSPRKRRAPGPKTGPKKDNLKLGFREHSNAAAESYTNILFIPKIK